MAIYPWYIPRNFAQTCRLLANMFVLVRTPLTSPVFSKMRVGSYFVHKYSRSNARVFGLSTGSRFGPKLNKSYKNLTFWHKSINIRRFVVEVVTDFKHVKWWTKLCTRMVYAFPLLDTIYSIIIMIIKVVHCMLPVQLDLKAIAGSWDEYTLWYTRLRCKCVDSISTLYW